MSVWNPPLRTLPGFVVFDYTAGFAYSTLPAPIRQACTLLTTASLADSDNPYGAIEVQLGKRRIKYSDHQHLGRTSLISKAYALLDYYRQRL